MRSMLSHPQRKSRHAKKRRSGPGAESGRKIAWAASNRNPVPRWKCRLQNNRKADAIPLPKVVLRCPSLALAFRLANLAMTARSYWCVQPLP